MNGLLGFFLIFCVSLSMINFTEAYTPKGTMSHEYDLPWHKMFLETDKIIIDVKVVNNLETKQNFSVDLKLESVSNPEQTHSIILLYDLKPSEEKIQQYRQSLLPGQWTLNLSLHRDDIDGPQEHAYITWIVVQPVQNFYSVVAAIGAILAGSGAILAVIFQLFYNKKNLENSQKVLKKTSEPFIHPRIFSNNESTNRLIGFANIGGGSAKDIHLDMLDAESGEELAPFEMFAMRNNRDDERSTDVNTNDHPFILVNGTYRNIIGEPKTIDILYIIEDKTIIDLSNS